VSPEITLVILQIWMSRRYYMVNGLFMFVKSVLPSWCFAFAVLLVSVTLNSRFCKYAVSFTATSLCHLSFGYDGAVVLDYHICQINVEFRWTIIQIFPDVIYAEWWWHMEWLSRQVKLAPWFFVLFCFVFEGVPLIFATSDQIIWENFCSLNW